MSASRICLLCTHAPHKSGSPLHTVYRTHRHSKGTVEQPQPSPFPTDQPYSWNKAPCLKACQGMLTVAGEETEYFSHISAQTFAACLEVKTSDLHSHKPMSKVPVGC